MNEAIAGDKQTILVEITRAEFLMLPVETRRRILGQQAKQLERYYEVTCPECGNYYAGHATGGDDICTCKRPNEKLCGGKNED